MKNIIKRIIVGVGIGLILGFINKCDVHAFTAQNFTIDSVYDAQFVLHNNTTKNQTVSNFTIGNLIGFRFGNWISSSITDSVNYAKFNFGSGLNSFSNNARSAHIYLLVRSLAPINLCYSTISACEVTGLQTNEINFTGYWYLLHYHSFTSSYTGSYGQYLFFDSAGNGIEYNIWIRNTLYYYDEYTNYETILNQINSTLSGLSLTSVNNKLDNLNQATQQQTEEIKNINDTLKDTSTPDSSEYNFSENNADNGVINQLVTMPITLTQAFLNGFNGSCTPFNLGNLMGTDLIIPCINPGSYLGTIWNIIDIIISGVFIYIFGKRLVKIFNDVTNMKENQIDEVFD